MSRFCEEFYKKGKKWFYNLFESLREGMGHFSSMFKWLARSFSIQKKKNSESCDGGRGAADAMAKDAKKNDLILRSSGFVNVDGSDNFASVFSKRGNKGVNQDCAIVWEVCSQRSCCLSVKCLGFWVEL